MKCFVRFVATIDGLSECSGKLDYILEQFDAAAQSKIVAWAKTAKVGGYIRPTPNTVVVCTQYR